jgi:ribosome-binding factor A
MSSRRLQKAAQAVRQVVSMAILTELKDPRVRDVTVTHVEMSPDMRYARVHVSIMGDEVRQKLSLAGLRSSAGFLQARLAEKIETRYTPRLVFELDQGVKRSIEIARLLKEVLPGTGAAPAEPAPEPQTDEDDESDLSEDDISPDPDDDNGASRGK